METLSSNSSAADTGQPESAWLNTRESDPLADNAEDASAAPRVDLTDTWMVSAATEQSDSSEGKTHVLDLIGDMARPAGPRDMSTRSPD